MYIPSFIILAICIFILYNVACIRKFKVPKTLSETYYLWKNNNAKTAFLFPTIMTIVVALLMPAWIEISEGNPFQFSAFLGAASLLFVAFAPNFRGLPIESKVHSYAAISSAIFSIIWIIAIPFIWYIGLSIIFGISIITYIILSFMTNNNVKSVFVYYIEMVAFYSTFAAIILYLIHG